MPVDLRELLAPARAALVTQECQNGVIGPEALLPELAAAARVEMVANVARLAAAARTVGAAVVHCVAARREDGRGGNTNAPLFTALARAHGRLVLGSRDVEVLPEIAAAGDITLTRLHGVGPMADTGLDRLLRNLGVTTVVADGVSVNVGVTDLVLDAVNAGYHVVLPRDAVAGVPADYADAMVEHTLRLLATVVRTADVLDVWGMRMRSR